MADENPPSTAPTTEVTSTETTAEAERSYTQAEVDALVKQTKDSTFAEARRVIKPKRQDEAKQQTTKNEKGAEPDRVIRILAQRDALDEALDGKSVSSDQKRWLRQQMEAADPDEPAAWLQSFPFMPGKSPTDTPTAQTKETPVAQRTPGDHPGVPQGAPPWETPSNPFEWGEAVIQRLVALKGQRAANSIIRQKAEAYARTMRIQMSPTRR
jgi:hypothetical protein